MTEVINLTVSVPPTFPINAPIQINMLPTNRVSELLILTLEHCKMKDSSQSYGFCVQSKSEIIQPETLIGRLPSVCIN